MVSTLPRMDRRPHQRPSCRVAKGAERIGLAAVWTFERLLRPIEPVSFGGFGRPALLPDIYANVYDPLETLSYVTAKARAGHRRRRADRR
jgi:hypothetical protein